MSQAGITSADVRKSGGTILVLEEEFNQSKKQCEFMTARAKQLDSQLQGLLGATKSMSINIQQLEAENQHLIKENEQLKAEIESRPTIPSLSE